MPITTYLNEFEKMSYLACSDKDLNELLQEVNSKIGGEGKYLIRERFFLTGRLWWKKVTKKYTLFYDYKSVDTQIINFAGDGTSPKKETIENYFIGLLNGLDSTLKIKDGLNPPARKEV